MIINDESLPLTAEDQPFFDELRKQFGHAFTEETCVRLARAFRHSKGRLQFTLNEAKKIAAWRAQNEVDRVLLKKLDNHKAFWEFWQSIAYGEDKEGHLVVVDRVSLSHLDNFVSNFNNQRFVPYRAQIMEQIQWEKLAISKRLGKRVYKHISVIDLKGLSMKHVTPSTLSQLKPIFDISQMNYPETLLRMYLINAPLFFYGVWKIIKTFIDPDVHEKIHVYKESQLDKFIQELEQTGVSKGSIPQYLGGGHPGRPLDNAFKPSLPDTPFPIVEALVNPLPSETK